MNEGGDTLWWIIMVLDPAIGAGFFIYGVRQKAALPLATGVALNILPFFAPNGALALAITFAIAAAYIVISKFQ